MNPRLSSEEADGVCRIRAEGDIRSVEEPRDPRDLEALLGPSCFRRKVLLDLQDALHIDSSGVSWLAHFHRRCRAAGGVLVVHSVPPSILAVFRLLGIQRDLHLADDERAALALADARAQAQAGARP